MSKTLKILLVLSGVLILGSLGAIGYIKYFRVTPEPTASPEATPTPSKMPSPTVSLITDPGVSWIAPQVLGDLGIIQKNTTTGIAEVNYYKTANLAGGGELILAKVTYDGPGIPEIVRFKKDGAGKYFYLTKHSTQKDYSAISNWITKDVSIDNTTIYQSLSAPDFLTVRNTVLKTATSEGLFADLGKNGTSTPKEIGETAYGKVYQENLAGLTAVTGKDVGGATFDQKLADSSYKVYTIKFDFITDDEVAQVTWADNTKNTAKYTPESYLGCAATASNNIILNDSNLADRLSVGGKTNTGDSVYLPVKNDDPVLKAAYENYKTGRTKDILSIADFAKKKPVFIWKSGLGVNVIFTGRDFAGLAECGKPVIYLYPTKEQEISVKLGVTITKSDPEYLNGWKVTALPDGTLKLGDKTYPYLFWEGKGQEYPLVNAGTVVAKKDTEKTIRKQLGQLGLNEKEINDFVEFWLSKMPNTPFVRLTWFGNQLMDRLAPIAVVPKPQTIIRVFLDFEGLPAKIEIPSQKLSAPARNGFTVVEWGGLLRK